MNGATENLPSQASIPSLLNKVPAVTFMFWVIKVLATTLGETGGDAVSMSMNLGYAVASGIFIAVFAIAVSIQLASTKFSPFLYWFAIVATTTAGTTMADYATRSLGIGYAGGSAILFIVLMASLAVWYANMGSVSVDSITTRRAETFYWVTILFSQTLGTALGDWVADTNGVGYEGAAILFGVVLTAVLAVHVFTHSSRTILFWTAFIFTRPLGATLGDLLDKPISHGGLAMDRFAATGVLAGFIIICIALTEHEPEATTAKSSR